MRKRLIAVTVMVAFALAGGWYVVAQDAALPTFEPGQILTATDLNSIVNQVEANTMAVADLAAANSGGQTLVLQFLGASSIVGNAAEVDAQEGTNIDFAALGVDGADFICFEMDLVDMATDFSMGRGIDCLRFDSPGAGTEEVVTASTMTVTVFSFFILERGATQGTLVNFGLTSLQPFVAGFGDGFIGGDPNNDQVTHMSGSIPTGAPSIVAATGAFEGVSGTARVSGAVSTTPLDGVSVGPSFDCMWEVTLN